MQGKQVRFVPRQYAKQALNFAHDFCTGKALTIQSGQFRAKFLNFAQAQLPPSLQPVAQ